jgi:pimeloyl-ACP methyl ester carboxylesterase
MPELAGLDHTLVLVHGAWHGAWCWQYVVGHLREQGCKVRTVELPSVGAAPGSNVDLSADAAAVRTVIAAQDGPVVLCGHSYGGMVITHAAASNAQVERLVYLCAFVPQRGESLLDLGGGQLAPWIHKVAGGLTMPDPSLGAALFYGDCDSATQSWALSSLRPQCEAPFLEPVTETPSPKLFSTYVVCTQDGALPCELQRQHFGSRTRRVLEFEASHSPFLSRPAELARLFTTEVRAAASA